MHSNIKKREVRCCHLTTVISWWREKNDLLMAKGEVFRTMLGTVYLGYLSFHRRQHYGSFSRDSNRYIRINYPDPALPVYAMGVVGSNNSQWVS